MVTKWTRYSTRLTVLFDTQVPFDSRLTSTRSISLQCAIEVSLLATLTYAVTIDCFLAAQSASTDFIFIYYFMCDFLQITDKVVCVRITVDWCIFLFAYRRTSAKQLIYFPFRLSHPTIIIHNTNWQLQWCYYGCYDKCGFAICSLCLSGSRRWHADLII